MARPHTATRPASRVRTGALLLLSAALVACDGAQSALATAGPDAARVARLWWWMAGGATLIWVVVVGLAWYAIRVNREEHSERGATLLIIGGGAVIPTVVLGGLLFYALSAMPSLLELPAEDGVRIEVSGEQWWWRVEYQLPDGATFELANEIYLPVGRRIETVLVSPDVIHSFWIPSIAGKMDMIPGRVNRLALEADRTGVFRGACAEYCGASHALMACTPWSWRSRSSTRGWRRRPRAPARRWTSGVATVEGSSWNLAVAPAMRCGARRRRAL